MENTLQLPGRRALRMATGTALCLSISFAFDFPIPVIAPVFAVFLLATQNRPMSFRAAAMLALVVMLTTGSGLLLVPLLRHYALAGVMLVGVLLFVAFLYGVRGGNNLVATFLVAGLTMISAAGTADFQVGATVVGALMKGLLLALLVKKLNLQVCRLGQHAVPIVVQGLHFGGVRGAEELLALPQPETVQVQHALKA